jgi:hypothetical protein
MDCWSACWHSWDSTPIRQVALNLAAAGDPFSSMLAMTTIAAKRRWYLYFLHIFNI